MKTMIALLAATTVVAGATGAAATEFQASDEAVNNALSHAAAWSYGGAYDSARAPGGVRNSTMIAPSQPNYQTDFQAGGRN
jgi:hypothetical protein